MRRLLAAAVLALLACTPATADAAPAQSSPGETVRIGGHGWGHGRGMGQYGALGYATEHGWSWQQITDHFYGGTSLGNLPPGRHEDVLLKGYSGRETLIAVDQGGLITNVDEMLPPLPGRTAVRVIAHGNGTFTVFQGTSCASWDAGTVVQPAPMGSRSILVAKPGVSGSNNAAEMISVCEPSGRRFYRGELWVAHFATTGIVGGSSTAKHHVMNHVWIEAYLRSVVPSESPSSWGTLSGGMHALAAQAIAARSYAAAGDTRYGWATTCDDVYCQVYSGFGFGPSPSSVTLREASTTNQAVAMTEGVVRMAGASVARTEFSSSTGGWTAGGAFPSVIDEGDDVRSNPNHNWSVDVPADRIEGAFDSYHGRDFGDLRSLVVIDRNDRGADGGRVVSIRVEFANGSSIVSGDRFRSLVGLKSDWFVVPTGPTTARFNDTSGHPHAANIEKVADAGIATGYPDGGFHPDDVVTRGQMATFIAKGYALPPASSPFSDTDGDTHEAGIGAVANAGIAQGRSDGTYGPTLPITRGQMAVFMARAEGLSPVDGTGGCDIEGHLYEGEIRAVLAAGIASGGTDGCFRPDEGVTRGQMATFLARALGL